MTTASFQWQDYLVFSVMLAISSIIGLYFGITSRRKKTVSADEMLTGGRSLPLLPVALSLSASFTSATTILGIPAEVYARGGEQWLWIFGIVPCFFFIGAFIVPVFHELQLTNAYEYLELRYNKVIRYFGSLAFCIIILLYMAAVLYAPAVALSQVTGISKQVSIIIMGVVCTFYTSIGGIRAVVWTDAFQLVVVWAGLLALLLKGASDAGGWTNVWEMAQNNSRLPRFEMDPDPFIRHSFWTFLIGGGLNMMTVYGGYQINLQRYSSVKTLKGARIALLLNAPIWVLYLTILSLLGLVMYAFFSCDPLSTKMVSSPDQLLPLFVMETMGSMPGLPGLFVASIFSASVSTLSSGINSMAAVTLEDLIKPLFRRRRDPRPIVLTIATMVLVAVFGLATIGLAYIIGNLGKTAFMIAFSIFGMIGGPLLSLILNGVFVPFINSMGAGCGMLASLVVTFYYGVYPIIYPISKGKLPAREETCGINNSTISNMTSMLANSTMATTTDLFNASKSTPSQEPFSSQDHPYISYLHLATIAVVVSFLVASVVSLLTGCNKGVNVDERTYYKYSWCRKSKSSDLISMKNGTNCDVIISEKDSSINNTIGTFNFSKNSH